VLKRAEDMWMRHSFMVLFVAMGVLAQPVAAQLVQNAPGSSLAPPATERAALQPLYAQADQLIYDTQHNRIVLQGNVEIYYSNYILTADQVSYDQSTEALVAEGNVHLKDPNGSVTRSDRLQLADEFCDAFRSSFDRIGADRRKP